MLWEVQIKAICLFETKPFLQRYYITVRDFGYCLLIYASYFIISFFANTSFGTLNNYMWLVYPINGDFNFAHLVKIVFSY